MERGKAITASWNSTRAAGSLLLAFLSSLMDRSMTPPPGWQLVTATNESPILRIYAIQGAAPSSGSQQFTFNGSTRATLTLVEYSGIAASGALDRIATSSGTTITASTGTTSVTSQANELAVTFLGALGSGFGPATNGFVEVAELATQSVVHEKVLTTTGSYDHTCRLSASGIPWQGVILTYRAKQLP